MGYAVELFLDECEAKRIRDSFSPLLHTIGASPHVTLAVFNDVDTAKLISLAGSLARSTPPFTMRFSAFGIFPGTQNVVFLSPVVTEALQEIHATFHVELAHAGLQSEPYYLPGSWIPHCAIAVEEPLGESLATIRRVHDQDLLGDYQIEYVHVVEFRPVVSLAAFALSGDVAE